jgi:hypothetical protein
MVLYSNSTGLQNTGIGAFALQTNTTGNNNTASGYNALLSNTTGNQNSAFGAEALRSNTTGFWNTAIGSFSLYWNSTGSFNTSVGYSALNDNTTGQSNTASGYWALLRNTTGSNNTAYGAAALRENITGVNNTAVGAGALSINKGSENTAIGNTALLSNQTGRDNTASGARALYSNFTGDRNTASGAFSLYANSTGSNNVGFGVDALRNNTSGRSNSASGEAALHSNTIGSSNTAYGNSALYSNTTGSFNTAIGFHAGFNGNYTNATSIGFQTSATASDQVRIGNAAITSIGGQVNWTNLSDGRYKKNIKEDVPGLEFINQLRPVTYNLDVEGIDNKLKAPAGAAMKTAGSEGEAIRSGISPEISQEELKAKANKARIKYTGFVAQEVEKAAKKLNYDFSGVDAPKNSEDFYGLRYSEFVVPLVKSVQELSAANEKQQQQIDQQQQQIDELKKLVNQLVNGRDVKPIGGNTNATLSSAYLEQNAPNPFNTTTIIKYHLPQGVSAASVIITNAKGQTLKNISLGAGGSGQVTLSAGSLTAGIYSYSLWVAGREVDTKKMMVVR